MTRNCYICGEKVFTGLTLGSMEGKSPDTIPPGESCAELIKWRALLHENIFFCATHTKMLEKFLEGAKLALAEGKNYEYLIPKIQ